MNCLKCDTRYAEVEYDDQSVLCCKQCSLFWFTQGQLARIDIVSDEFEELIKSLELNPDTSELDQDTCSICELVIHKRSYSTAPHVKIAECYKCGGIALSSAQIKEIRENSMSSKQLEAYLSQIAHSVPGFTEVENTRVQRGGFGGFSKSWQKARFWAKKKDA